MMIVCTYNQLRSLELRTLNSERLEILSQKWVKDREALSPRIVSQLEGFGGGVSKSGKNEIPTSFGLLEDVASNPWEITELMQAHQEDKYVVSVRDPLKPRIRVSLRLENPSSSNFCSLHMPVSSLLYRDFELLVFCFEQLK